MNFYDGKSKTLPRMLYRYLADEVRTNAAIDIVEKAEGFIKNSKGPDFLKMVWRIPDYLRSQLDEKQLNELESFCHRQNGRRPEKVKKHVFPHVSDEFSLSPDFLCEAFDANALTTISGTDVIFTIGSCFARNFSNYLAARGVNCKNFGQSEDLNSPGSNKVLIEYACHIDQEDCKARLLEQVRRIWHDLEPDDIEKIYAQQLQSLQSLKGSLVSATKVIITLGNTVDYYEKDDTDLELLVPKFLAMSSNEDLRVRESVSARLAKLDTFIRLSNFTEVSRYIHEIYQCIRAVNPDCHITFTVSPVPIDSVLGLQGTNLRAVEVDCVSKSTIRAALHEVMHGYPEISTDSKVHYLPSFEIVRWVAPVVGIPVFGAEDAASRHVSSAVLNAVCSFAYRPV